MDQDGVPTWLLDAAERFGARIGVPPELGRPAIMRLTGLSDHKARRLLDYLYDLADEQAARQTDEEPAAADDDAVEYDVTQYIDQDGYAYDDEADVYTTVLNDGTAYKIPGHVHRAMKRDYSDWDGNPRTLNQVCRRFGMRRRHFVEYKRVHGWTHDSSPFTNEELRDQETRVLLGDLAKQREGALEKAWDRKRQAALLEAAARWENLERGILAPLAARLEALRGAAPAAPRVTLDAASSEPPFAVVLGLTDQHHGKLGRVGDTYSRAESRARFEATTREVLRDIARWGTPERVFIPFGSDWTHIDTLLKTTTSGKPQDLDGLPEEVIEEAFTMFFAGVDMVRQVTPHVELIPMRGNHDRLIGWILGLAAALRYEGAPDVTVTLSPHPRNYTTYGVTLLGFDHGDGRRLKDFQSLVPFEAKEAWSTARSAIMFTDDKHHEEVLKSEVKDLGRGLVVRQMPCVAGDDDWHVRSGFVGAWKALAAYVLRRDTGIKHVIYADVTGAQLEPTDGEGMLTP